MKYEVINKCANEYPVDFMCHVFDVSKSGFYEWRRRLNSPSSRERRRAKLERTIEAVHLGSDRKLGSPKVRSVTVGLGFGESPSTVARIMKRLGLRSKFKRKFKATTDSDHKLPVAPNHVMQDFRTFQPNQIWMSDLTYVKTAEGWLYVCAVIDLYSSKIVGWAASSRMTVDLVQAAYLRACKERSPGIGLIFHSDRGSQYAARAFSKMLAKEGHIQSMSRRGNCWDSAPIESFWHLLKTERTYWDHYKTRQQAMLTIRIWIEEYNAIRPHSAIGYLSPNNFERKGVAMQTRKI